MNWKEIKIAYREYSGVEKLPDDLKSLVMDARKASANAWSAYSGLNVGAAVKLANGTVITGNNQENAAFPAGLCAERTALFYANANYPDEAVVAIAVSASNHSGILPDPIKPCGICRQVMLETETRYEKPFTIILEGKDSIIVLDGIDSLLPLNFKNSDF